MSTQNWLVEYAERSLGDFEATAQIDRELSGRAMAARDDRQARDELFVMLAAKIQRFAARFAYWSLDPWNHDDVLQETFPVFVATIYRWTPRYVDGAPAGYLYYFLRVYPLWLANAVNRLTGRHRPASLPLPDSPIGDVDPGPYESGVAVRLMLNDLCEQLTEEEATLLRLRVTRDQTLPEAAAQAGIARRTAYRRWHNVVQLSRQYWEEEREAG